MLWTHQDDEGKVKVGEGKVGNSRRPHIYIGTEGGRGEGLGEGRAMYAPSFQCSGAMAAFVETALGVCARVCQGFMCVCVC